MTTLVLSNPHSKRAATQLAAVESVAAATVGVEHAVTQSAADVCALLRRYDLGADDVLVLHGGDGTVQHALTRLINSTSVGDVPMIAILPGGTTNMTARDLNVSRSMRGCLRTLAGGRSAGIERDVLAVSDGEAVRHGFFFGAGAIVHGIRYFHESAEAGGTLVALGRALWGVYRRQPPYADAVEVAVDGCVRQRLLVLVTTLERLINGTTPYWGDDSGALKLTSIQHDAERLVRSFARLLRGRAPRAKGYTSTNVEDLRLGFQGPYTLDGEMFETRGQDLEIEPISLRIWPL